MKSSRGVGKKGSFTVTKQEINSLLHIADTFNRLPHTLR